MATGIPRIKAATVTRKMLMPVCQEYKKKEELSILGLLMSI
jgi:hypothetical protein